MAFNPEPGLQAFVDMRGKIGQLKKRYTTIQEYTETETILADLKGLKRICMSCGARFYDLNKKPIICPSCSAEFTGEIKVKARRGRLPAEIAEDQVDDEDVNESTEVESDAEEGDEETVSLEEIDEDGDDEDEDLLVEDDDLEDIDDEDLDDIDDEDIDEDIAEEDEEK